MRRLCTESRKPRLACTGSIGPVTGTHLEAGQRQEGRGRLPAGFQGARGGGGAQGDVDGGRYLAQLPLRLRALGQDLVVQLLHLRPHGTHVFEDRVLRSG